MRKLLAFLVVCGLFTLGLGCGGPTTGKKDGKTPAKTGGDAAKPADSAMPTTDKPAADKPAADKPETDKPAADKPAADKPAADKPADKPAADKPETDKPADKPADKP